MIKKYIFGGLLLFGMSAEAMFVGGLQRVFHLCRAQRTLPLVFKRYARPLVPTPIEKLEQKTWDHFRRIFGEEIQRAEFPYDGYWWKLHTLLAFPHYFTRDYLHFVLVAEKRSQLQDIVHLQSDEQMTKKAACERYKKAVEKEFWSMLTEYSKNEEHVDAIQKFLETPDEKTASHQFVKDSMKEFNEILQMARERESIVNDVEEVFSGK